MAVRQKSKWIRAAEVPGAATLVIEAAKMATLLAGAFWGLAERPREALGGGSVESNALSRNHCLRCAADNGEVRTVDGGRPVPGAPCALDVVGQRNHAEARGVGHQHFVRIRNGLRPFWG